MQRYIYVRLNICIPYKVITQISLGNIWHHTLLQYLLTLFTMPHFTSGYCHFKMSSCIRYQLVIDSHSALTHNIKGTVYIISTAQYWILVSELDWKEETMKATFLYNKYKGRLTWTPDLHSKEGASVRMSDRTRRTQNIAGWCSWIFQEALFNINEGLECM